MPSSTPNRGELLGAGVLRNRLTGFKKDNWEQILSVWQSGQYRAPVIKPLPVKHPAIIDEFPLGRVELS